MAMKRSWTPAAAAIVAATLAVLFTALRPDVHAQATQTYNGFTVTPFTCRITAQTVTKECKALTTGQRTYVTDVILSNNVGTAQTLKVITGTGADCATGAADLTHAVQFGAAVGNFNQALATPLQPTAAGLAVCVVPSAATSYSATLGGFVVQ